MSEVVHQPLGIGLHVAIIMDGNGRWAQQRGLPRAEGHRAGVRAVRRVVEAAVQERIDILTLFAFSSDNWRRPTTEVGSLFELLREYLDREVRRCAEGGVRLSVIGRRDRLPAPLGAAIAAAERATVGQARLRLRLAVDYSSRDAILRAARLRASRALETVATREVFGRLVAAPALAPPGPPEAAGALPPIPLPTPAEAEVDLLIRTGGERRLSDFLLWESAYAELMFTDTMWPDFGPPELGAALREYRRRERRFGGLAATG